MKQIYKILLFYILLFINYGVVANSLHDDSIISSKYFNEIKSGYTEILALPTATISGGTTVCQNATANVTFTGDKGTAPYTFTYKIDNGSNLTISTTGTNKSISIPVNTSFTGTFKYTLISVSDKTSTTQTQTGSTTFNVSAPPTVSLSSDKNDICSGISVKFNSTVTGTGPYTYSWDFGDSSIDSTQPNPSHTFDALGCGTSTFNVKLTVSGNGCIVIKTLVINVKQKPDIKFEDINATGAGNQFNNCSNAANNSVYSITVGNLSSSSCVSSYSINWGDSTTDVTNVTFPISHTYNQTGAYNMIITAIGTNGCKNSKSYIIKNVSNPLGGLNSPGSTQNLCAPTTNLQFSISNWGTNSKDTTYTIDYGDNSLPTVLTQDQLIASSYYDSTKPSLSTNYPIPHIYNSSNCPVLSFVVKLDVTNACGTTPFTLANITILKKPVADFKAPSNACVNTNVIFNNTTIPGSDSGCIGTAKYIWNFGDPASGSSNTINTGFVDTIPNANHIFSSSGNYIVTLSAQNSCGTTTYTQQICIEPPLTPLFSLNKNSGCIPLAVTSTNNTILTNQCSPPTYDWTGTYLGGNCGTASAFTYAAGTSATSASPSFNFTESGTYSIKVALTNSCGTVSSSIQTIVVKKPPTVLIAAIPNYCGTASINPSATIESCAPASSTLTYEWSFPGGTPATANTANPGTINYSTNGNYTVSLVVTNECGSSVKATLLFSVNTAPVITNTSLSQSICSGSQTTSVNLTANPATTTFKWTAIATAGIAGFTSSGSANTIPVQTITTTSTTAGTVTYAIIPSVGGCAGTPINYIINVNPAPSITTQPTSSTVCLGGTPTALSVALNSTAVTPTYQWYSNTSNSTTGSTLISGATNASFNPPATAVGTLYYYCVITLSAGGCSSINSNIVEVTINPLPTIATQPLPSQELCVGVTIASPLSVSYSGGSGVAKYQWYNNINNTTIGGTPVGTNAPNYTPPVFTSAAVYFYYVIISLSDNNCGTTSSNVALVSVFNDPTITTQPITTQTLCQGAMPTTLQVVASGGNGPFSYQWYSNNANNTTSGTAIMGATSATYIPPTTIVGTIYYYCIISQTATSGCNVTSATATVFINASPTIVNQPISSIVCSGGTPTVLSLTFSNGVGTTAYQWYSNTGNNNTTGTAIGGETNPTYSPPANSVGTIYYYSTITFSGIAGSCATIATNTAEVTITAGSTIIQQPQPTESLCVGTTILNPLTVTYTGGTGTPSYQWFSSTTNSNIGGTAIIGATNVNYTPPVYTISGTYYYYVIINFSGNGCGAITSNVAEVIVVNDPIITTQPIATQTVCQNSPSTVLTAIASGGIGSTYDYKWFSSTINNTTSGVAISGETNSTFTPPTSIAETLYYYCEVTQINGTGCNTSSTTSEVIINVAPAINSQPISSTVCVNGTPSVLSFTYSNGVGTPIFQWYSNTINSNTGGTIIASATNATYAPPSAISGTNYYYCEITFPSLSGGCSVITTNTVSVIVNDNPVIAPVTSTICSARAFAVSPVNGGTTIVPIGTTYTWSAPTINPSGTITGASNQSTPQNDISQTLINTSTNPSTVTYTVIPTSGTCIGIDFAITVTVNPAINPNIVLDNNKCFGVNSATITTNVTGGIPFGSVRPYNISWTGPNGFTSSATSILNIAPGNYDVNIADAGGCPFSNSYIITEPEEIAITIDNKNDISCFGSANGSINLTVTGGTGDYVYTWTKNTFPYPDVTQDIPNLSSGTYLLSVTDANNCEPKTVTFTITEPPLLVVRVVSQTNVLCFGAATGEIIVNIGGGTVVSGYNFSWTGPNGFTANIQNLTSLFAGTYNLTVTDANGCQKNITATITQSAEIIIAYTTTPITCYGANNAAMTVTLSGGNAPYQYQWSNLSTTLMQTNLSAGDYTITVTDNVGCPKTQTITIPEALLFSVNPIVKNISCFGAQDGSINLNFVGGIPVINLTWSDGSTSGTIRNNLGPGTYSVTIIDGTPCTIKRTFTIVEPKTVVVSANLINAFNCTNASSGAIDLIVAGGTLPYTYVWSDGSSLEDLNNITSGNYFVTVTDTNGCAKTGQYAIIRPDPILIKVETQTTFDCDKHEVKQKFVAQISGGIPPYQLQWSSGTSSGVNNEIMTTDTNGIVVLTVKDSFRCVATQTVAVDTPELGYTSFDAASYGYTTYGIYSITDPIQFTSTVTGDYESIYWDFGDGTFSSELNPIHTYSIPKNYIVKQTVTYPFKCVYQYTISLLVEKGYLLVVPNAFTPNGDTLNDTFRPVTRALKNVHLNVYDTWGSLIYSETGEVLRGWDATIKGLDAENGNYYCKVSAETFYGTIVNENHPFVLIK